MNDQDRTPTARRILESTVSQCPKCESDHTVSGHGLPGPNDDLTVARCNACGHTWCRECGRPLRDLPCTHIVTWWALCDAWGLTEDDKHYQEVCELHVKIHRDVYAGD